MSPCYKPPFSFSFLHPFFLEYFYSHFSDSTSFYDKETSSSLTFIFFLLARLSSPFFRFLYL